jgi:hypothetical protein
MSAERWGTAFQRFVDAVNRPRDGAVLGAAVADDIRIERHEAGERATAPLVETFTGAAEVARWLTRTPSVVVFALAGAAWPDGDDTWGVQYEIRAGEFRNGGIWLARLAGDGRIAFLSHHPFALREER